MRNYTYNEMKLQPTGKTHTVELYEFHELADDAQARIIAEYDEERQGDPYFSQWFADCYESEIWDAVRDLEKSITGVRVQWRYNPWYSCDFDVVFSYDDCYDPCELAPVEDNGYYASMDVCDAWNNHIRKLNAISAHIDYLYQAEDALYDSGYMDLVAIGGTKRGHRPGANVAFRIDELRGDIIGRWYEELEKACDDVRDAIEIILRNEWDYYASEEYARENFVANEAGYECRTIDSSGRVYYHDSRKWYTADGELFEESNIVHKCVSIVRAGA